MINTKDFPWHGLNRKKKKSQKEKPQMNTHLFTQMELNKMQLLSAFFPY